ncbi:hypothetical protein WQQ_04540 [Hydrocarboniphaga effusa AP103]|uniref:Uncharacterized protein n=1 Tax=Hydrocarboniphaga effusa AP103 TaxID=1172194 RepID=I7ZF25_9GAMM|nr:hypothetical protein WQQ_04540 [Hydrocarboniphaga effusa AP103]
MHDIYPLKKYARSMPTRNNSWRNAKRSDKCSHEVSTRAASTAKQSM